MGSGAAEHQPNAMEDLEDHFSNSADPIKFNAPVLFSVTPSIIKSITPYP